MNIDQEQKEKVSKNKHKEVNQSGISSKQSGISNNPSSSSGLSLKIQHNPSTSKETECTIQEQQLKEQSELPKMEISSDKTINTENNENFLFNQELPGDPSLKDLEDFFSNLDYSNENVQELINNAHEVIKEVMNEPTNNRLSPINEDEEGVDEDEGEEREEEKADQADPVIIPDEAGVSRVNEPVIIPDEADISDETSTDMIITSEDTVSHKVKQTVTDNDTSVHNGTIADSVSGTVDTSIHSDTVIHSVHSDTATNGVCDPIANDNMITGSVCDSFTSGISQCVSDNVCLIPDRVDLSPVVELVTEEELANMPELITQEVINKRVIISDIIEEFIIEDDEPEPKVSKTFNTITIIFLIIFIIIGTIILLNPNNIIHN
ncbi:hypothetical protein NEIG_02279 [Nematocida sp. ERTm5]|nr:hypothetical protein NEIG_02279 [Nematocida sp. ERTm5]